MHVVTHLLAGWALAEQTKLEKRDKAIVAWASVAPDLDGFGLPIDWATRALGDGTTLYETYHHVAGHGLPAATLFTVREPEKDSRLMTYAAKSHARLSRRGELLVTYIINSTEFGQIAADASLYRPRFVRVPLSLLPEPP